MIVQHWLTKSHCCGIIRQREGRREPLAMSGLAALVGMRREKERARIDIAASALTGEPFGHTLLEGIGGCGKTAFARAIAEELGYHTIVVEGAALKTRDHVINRLVSAHEEAQSLGKRLLLFIDEVHRLSGPQQEVFYYPMDRVDPRITTANKTIHFKPFTLVAATTRKDILDQASFVNRFSNIWRISRFSVSDICMILTEHFTRKNMSYDLAILNVIAQRSLGIPRQALRLADKVINRTLSCGRCDIATEDCEVVFKLEGIDKNGLSELHIAYLQVLAEAQGQPRGLDGVAAAISEHRDVVAGTIEPTLLSLRLIDRSPRGRVITSKGLGYLTK